jgi:hypothetical protein
MEMKNLSHQPDHFSSSLRHKKFNNLHLLHSISTKMPLLFYRPAVQQDESNAATSLISPDVEPKSFIAHVTSTGPAAEQVASACTNDKSLDDELMLLVADVIRGDIEYTPYNNDDQEETIENSCDEDAATTPFFLDISQYVKDLSVNGNSSQKTCHIKTAASQEVWPAEQNSCGSKVVDSNAHTGDYQIAPNNRVSAFMRPFEQRVSEKQSNVKICHPSRIISTTVGEHIPSTEPCSEVGSDEPRADSSLTLIVSQATSNPSSVGCSSAVTDNQEYNSTICKVVDVEHHT